MTGDLFDHALQERMKQEAPLAARMRPRTLDEYIGQEHIVGEGKLLRELLVRPDEVFHAASTMKLPVMIELFRQVVEDRHHPDQLSLL